MKKTFLIFVFIFSMVFVFFVAHLNAQALAPLVGSEPVISMDFQDANIKDVLKILSMQSGMNFIASEAVANRKITLYFDKVPLSQAMDKIFSANNLSYELDSKANIFVVKDWGKMDVETVTKVFFLKNATVSTSSLQDQLSKRDSNSSDTTKSEVNSRSRFKEEGEGGITSAIKKLITPVIGSIVEDFRTNSLIITDTPMKMKVISQVVASLDVSVPQVILEVEMLDVSKDAIDKVGFEFGDTPFTAIITGATASTGFPFGSWSKIFPTASVVDAATGAATYPGRGTLSIDPASNSYQMQLDFMRTRTDTKFLARPKLLTLNNETAEISITKDQAIQVTPEYSTNNGSTYLSGYTVDRATGLKLTAKGIGISLKVTPQINLEANEITLVINPESSSVSISSISTAAIPVLDPEVRSSKSIVKIKDGETVILGGLIHQEKGVIFKKLPILGDIPLLGALFRHKEDTAGLERELIIFITPRIVRDNQVKSEQMQRLSLPIREQSAVTTHVNRDYLINSSLNNFDKKR